MSVPRKLSAQDRLPPPPPPARDGPPPPPARTDLPPPPPVPRRDGPDTSSLRGAAVPPPPARTSPRKESNDGPSPSPLARSTVAGKGPAGKASAAAPSVPGRASVGSAPRPPPPAPAREDLRASLQNTALPPPPPSRAPLSRGATIDVASPVARSLSPAPPQRSMSPAPPRRGDMSPAPMRNQSPAPPRRAEMSPAPPPRDDLPEETPAEEPEPEPEPPRRPPPPAARTPPPPPSLRGPPKPPPRDDEPAAEEAPAEAEPEAEEERAVPPPPRAALTQSAPERPPPMNSFAAVATAVMKKPPAVVAAAAPPVARRGTTGESGRPIITMNKPPPLTTPPPMARPPPINAFSSPPPPGRKPSVAGEAPAVSAPPVSPPSRPFASPPSLRGPSPLSNPPQPQRPSYGDEYAQEEASSSSGASSASSSTYVDASAYSGGKYPAEKAARLVQHAFRRWKTLVTTKRLAKRAWTLRRFFNSEKLYVQILSAIVGGIVRRIPDKSRAPPLFENLEPIANLHGQSLPQVQAAVQALKDGPSGVLPVLSNFARSVHLYVTYSDSYRNALSAFIQCRTQSSFVKFVENCEEKLGGEPLLPCLMQPLTRFREYVHYTKLLVQWTSRSNPEYPELAALLPTMEASFKQLTEGTKVAQDLDRTRLFILESIGAQLKMKDIVNQPGRAHVRSMDIMVQDVKGKQSKIHFHLFTDVVLITKRKDDKVKQSTTLDLKSYIQDEADKGSLRNWFRLVTPREAIIFVAETPQEKMKALWAFRDAFEQLRIQRGAETMTDPIIRRPPRNIGTGRRRKKPAASGSSRAGGSENNAASAFTGQLPPAVKNVLAKAGVTERDLADPKTAEFIFKWLQATMGQQTNAASKYTLKPIAQPGGGNAPSAGSAPAPLSPLSASQSFPSAPRAPGPAPPSPGPRPGAPAPPAAPRAPAAPAPPPPPKAPKAPPPPPKGGFKKAAAAAYEEQAEEYADESAGYEEQPAEEAPAEEAPAEEAAEEAPQAGGGLLAALKGAQLKKVEAPPPAQFKQISAAEEDGLAAALSKALQARRPALAEKNEEEEEEEDYNADWD